jgi:hypothetical protein
MAGLPKERRAGALGSGGPPRGPLCSQHEISLTRRATPDSTNASDPAGCDLWGRANVAHAYSPRESEGTGQRQQ